MKLSKMYLKTYKECPLNVTSDSLKLLYRAGFVKYLEDLSYSYTPLGNLFFNNLIEIILDNFEEYMNIKANGDKVNILKSYISDLKSYKNIPLNLAYFTLNKNRGYKFKDGLLNPRKENMIRFIKVTSKEDINTSIQETIKKINCMLEELNIKYMYLKNEENNLRYFYKCNYPLREVFFCEKCGYGSLKEEAKSSFEKDLSTEELKNTQSIYTPNIGKIEDLQAFLNISRKKLIKTLLFNVNAEIIAVLLRGDRSINLRLLAKFLNVKEKEIKMASEEEVKLATNANVGFAGPIGLKVNKIFADEEILYIKNAVVGANKTDYHIKNVNYQRDFKVDDIGNFKLVERGHTCIKCESLLKSFDGTNFIDINVLESDFKYLNYNGKEEKLYILETKFYTDRLFSIIVEENKDELGIKWPESISYFDYHIIIGNIKKEQEYSAGNLIYENLIKKGYTVLLDDRKERIGFKFKDYELIGIPKAIVVGKEIENNFVEIRNRISKESENIDISELI
ncbi:proline--tRNA ligase [Tepidibacter formicigenes]|jgi:prolyl-tRNA synthetase|uniref:Prolyl-tRNA synthetase n=1 Tax=Tepidibacter formicigenes DSM 15518 TaxID=1123349 RepID=A0A1M6QLS2_9FIRM|nr:YbaK/EbsC family protein [Tepidibacter formicigenes]SHK20967.1 prolyl-tRNA synthetase [Tepidibacter formicigenes DSM 15518]